jgi:NADH-quinone oxidoreductase subunit H
VLSVPCISRVRAVVPASLLLALALGCFLLGRGSFSREAQLLAVREIIPREVEAGDLVSISGSGFLPGKMARVTFRGTLFRPGRHPSRGAEISASARATGAERLELAFDEATQALFSGAGERSAHTTFDGDIEVAFPAGAPGAAPASGVLQHATLDVRPSETASVDDREGKRLLAWIGVKAAARGSGLLVEAVEPGSRAEAAGMVTGDLVTRFDGVLVGSAADMVPPPGERWATIVVRTGRDAREETRVVAMDGFRGAPPAELLGAGLIALSALGIVGLFAAPTGAPLSAVLQRVVARIRERVRAARERTTAGRPRRGRAEPEPWALLRTLAAVGRAALPPYALSAAADLAPCALLAAMPFGQYVIATRLDVGLIFAAAATSLAAGAFVRNGSWRGAGAALRVALEHVPAAVAVASVVMTTGSLRVQEIERAQGAWPWDWLAFRSPGALLALGLLLTSTRIEPESRLLDAGLSRWLEDADAAPEPRTPWLGATCRAHHVAMAGLATTLFLGGWHIPGLSASERDPGLALELAGAAWLLVKTWSLVVVMAWVGWALPRWDVGRTTCATWLRLGSTAVAALISTAAWTWWSPSPAAQLLVSFSLLGAVFLTAIALGHRLRHGLSGMAGEGRVSGFI